jgi:peroxiredoxin
MINMKMKFVLSLGVLFILLFTSCSKKQEEKKEELKVEEIQPPVTNDLPTMQVGLLDGSTINAKEIKGKTVLVLFQPDCDHCQNEAKQIQQHLADFKDYNIYFVSSAAPEEIHKFSVDYKLTGLPNVSFGFTTVQNVLDNFGSIQAPSIYIYTDNGKLKTHFNGEIEVEEITRQL